MKKIITLLLVCTMALGMVACGGDKKESSSNENSSNNSANTVTKPAETDSTNTTPDSGNTQEEVNPVELAFFPKTSTDAGAYATIKVSEKVKMDDETAWLGLCPDGKDYITEAEADEVDVIYYYSDAREEGDPYVFACDFSDVQDGTYALIVATSDDENVGYVVIQLSMTKAGDKLTFDYSNAKIKERPAK